MPFLSEDFVALDDGGLDSFIAALNSRLQVTNDALDLGFAARAPTFTGSANTCWARTPPHAS